MHQLQSAKRWSGSDAKRIDIGQPFLIKHYNKAMVGVEPMDQNVDKYRTTIRSQKCWWPVFALCLDVDIQQVWHVFRLTQCTVDKTNDLLAVRHTITRACLAHGPHRSTPGRPHKHSRNIFSSDNKLLPAVQILCNLFFAEIAKL